ENALGALVPALDPSVGSQQENSIVCHTRTGSDSPLLTPGRRPSAHALSFHNSTLCSAPPRCLGEAVAAVARLDDAGRAAAVPFIQGNRGQIAYHLQNRPAAAAFSRSPAGPQAYNKLRGLRGGNNAPKQPTARRNDVPPSLPSFHPAEQERHAMT